MNLIEPSTLSQPDGAAAASRAPKLRRKPTTPAQASFGHGACFILLLWPTGSAQLTCEDRRLGMGPEGGGPPVNSNYLSALASPSPFSERMNVAARPSSAPPPPVTSTSGMTSRLPSDSALAMATAAVGVEPRLSTCAW